jgi:hypothetical protein
MLGEGGTPFAEWLAATRKFLARTERGDMDLAEYRGAIDALDGDFGSEARDAQKAGAHLVNGNITAASWIARTCKIGWQVIKSGREFRFLPPERVFMRRVRGPGMRWAA